MRREKRLVERVSSLESLYRAFLGAAAGKRDRRAVREYEFDLETHLWETRRRLLAEAYAWSPYRRFEISDPKRREIRAPAFRDRIVHHAIVDVTNPIFERGFIADTYACIRGRGQHRAVERHRCFSRSRQGCGYVLRCDVAAYFRSIDHEVLRGLLARRIGDRRLLALLESLIAHGAEAPGVGMPIGSLTSQMFANLYLDPLDHFVKERLRVRHYVRYMDDFVVLAADRAEARHRLGEIEAFLAERLRLGLNPRRTVIAPLSAPLDFLGYVHRAGGGTRVRRRSVRRLRRRLPALAEGLDAGEIGWDGARASVASWTGPPATPTPSGSRARSSASATFATSASDCWWRAWRNLRLRLATRDLTGASDLCAADQKPVRRRPVSTSRRQHDCLLVSDRHPAPSRGFARRSRQRPATRSSAWLEERESFSEHCLGRARGLCADAPLALPPVRSRRLDRGHPLDGVPDCVLQTSDCIALHAIIKAMNDRGELLREVMVGTGTTQSELSRVSGVRQPSISQMLSGKIEMSDEQLDRLLSCMGHRLEVERQPVVPRLTRSERRSWQLHRQLSTQLNRPRLDNWRPTLDRNLTRLRRGVRGQPHERNLERWESLIKRGDVPGLHRVLTGLDRGSIEMREVSPLSGLLSSEERRKVLESER